MANGRCRRATTATRATARLSKINTQNVQNLHVVATASTGIPHGHEGQPLVVGSTLYIVTPFPNNLIALDLTKPGFPQKWIFQPESRYQRRVGIACCDVVNRGASFADGKIIYNTLDAHTVAVDANTGKMVWETQVGDIHLGETTTMAPHRREECRSRGRQRRRTGRARPTDGARSQNRQNSVARLQQRLRMRTSASARISSRSTRRIGARTSASKPGRRVSGRRAAARSGAGFPTIRN